MENAVWAMENHRKAEEAAAEARKRELWERVPGVREIDHALRTLPLDILSSALAGKNVPEETEKIKVKTRELQETRRRLLKEAGFSEDYDRVRENCPVCHDYGYSGGKMCECLRRAVAREEAKRSGLSRRLESQTFENFDLSYYSDALLPDKTYSARDVMAGILRDAEEYAENFSPNSPSLLFIGGTGLGKTHLSGAIASKVIEKGFEVVYESAPRVMAAFERERFDAENGGETMARLTECEFLVLDDLGTEAPSRAAASFVYTLVNTRVSVRRLPTLISTNLSYMGLEKQYDTAVVSRLFGEFEVKLFQGEDVRLQKLH